MKNNRLGLLMIAASLLVIAIISVLLYQYQIESNTQKTRINGVALTRALSNTELSQVLGTHQEIDWVHHLIDIQDDQSFSYIVVVNVAGEKLYEITSAGSIVPTATMPTKPFAWFGEHNLTSPGDQREIREFFAPIMADGQLFGFVRAGYFKSDINLLSGQISSLALFALPIFLLTVLSYYLIRREIKPLRQLSEKMEQASATYGAQHVVPAGEYDLTDFVKRFDQFMNIVQSKVEQVDKEVTGKQTVTHLLTYKQEKAEAALSSIPDAVLVLDNTCTPTFANQKIEPLLGVNRENIIGKQPHEWCENEEVLAFLMRFNNAASVKTAANIEYMPEGKADVHISVSAFPLFSPRDQDTLFGTLIVFRDVSKAHMAKQAGSEFVSHVSHELKTPLNTLLAYSELLQDYASLEEQDRVDAVNVIHEEVERMSGLINNLLNISKMETGTLQLNRKRVKMQDLLQGAFDSISNHALGRGIELVLKISPDIESVRLDKGMFRIAVDNLLSNAVKYSNDGGKVMMSASMLDDGQTRISIQDQGIGMSEEDCKKVFHKYYRASNSETESRSGHGLGLYLAKQIIELHHGSISVNSELGKGTEFSITFKAQPIQLEESQAA